MRQQFKTVLLVVLALAISLDLSAARAKTTIEKVITKEFSVNSDVNLSMNHSYGDIIIARGSDDKITMRITVELSSSKSKITTNIDDCFGLDIDATRSAVNIKTHYKMVGMPKHERLKIDYYVTVPRGYRPDVNIKYGRLSLQSALQNGAAVSVMYGDLNADEIKGDSCMVRARYSDISIAEVENLSLDINYGDAEVDSCQKAVVNAKYSDIKFDQVGDLTVDCLYGDIVIDRLSGSFCSERLTYSDAKLAVADGARLVKLKGAYSDLKLSLAPKQQFHAKISGSYGDVKFPDNIVWSSDRRIEKSSGISFNYDLNNIKAGSQDALELDMVMRYSDIIIMGD